MMRFLYILILLLVFNCKSVQKLDVQGHRGCRGLLPENSLPGFAKAIDLGATTLELDLAISKDKKVVVSHEPYMNHEIALDAFGDEIKRSEEKGYNLYTMTYDSIQLYDCGSKTHPRFPNQEKITVYKPLLMEVIQMADRKTNKKIKYNIEIKSHRNYDGVYTPHIKEFIALTLKVINEAKISKRVNLQSFDIRALESIHEQAPKIKTALLIGGNESIDDKLSKLSFKPEIISPSFELLDKISVAEYHRKNYRVVPWTVNTKEDIQKMIDFEVDGIISDYPDKVVEVYNKTKQ